MSKFLALEDLKAYIESLDRIPFLDSFKGDYLEEMFKASELREYEPGETIIAEGALDRAIYFLLIGEVKVMKGGVEIARIARYGEIFGEQALIDNTARSATVVAAAPCFCMSVDAQFIEKLQPAEQAACYTVIYRISAHVLSERLKKTTAELAHVERKLERLERKHR
ncbi:MAG: cyclic nucleotide-binding domain-containing protein [Kiritimatiellae bacterium]|nr:cyclic nucleotide-binding domain-containing protein [Kiritimatiellia bacterium]